MRRTEPRLQSVVRTRIVTVGWLRAVSLLVRGRAKRGMPWTVSILMRSRGRRGRKCRRRRSLSVPPAPTTRSVLHENVTAWRSLRLRPRVLRDIAAVDTSVTLLGSKLPTPILVAPTGRHKLFNPEGERATARGAAAANVPYVMATNANVTIEEVAAERKSAPQWFQLYYWPNRAEVEALIDRLVAAGFGALVLTVDAPVPGWSPRAARAAARAIARYPQHQHAGLADGAHRLSSRFRRQGHVSGDLARTGMAGEAFASAGDGQGRAARRTMPYEARNAARAPSSSPITAAAISTPR